MSWSLCNGPSPCYKKNMGKIRGRWVLYEYKDGEFIHVSKLLKTKKEAEQQRSKLLALGHKANSLGVGFIRTA
jgi:hypothetical protein